MTIRSCGTLYSIKWFLKQHVKHCKMIILLNHLCMYGTLLLPNTE